MIKRLNLTLEGDQAPQNLTQEVKAPDPDALIPAPPNFPNITGQEAANLYRQYTGKRVLVSAAAKDAQIFFVQAPPLTYRQASRLLEEAFLMEGFQFTPSERDPGLVKLLAANNAGGPAGVIQPPPVIDDPAELALTNGIVSYVMTFQFLKPVEAQRAFTQIFSQLRPGGTIAEVSNASSLIITEKAELIQKLVEIKEKIDVPSAQIATDFVEVRYADVQELADQLTSMFSSSSGQNQSARAQRQQTNTPQIPGIQNAAGGGNAGAAGEETPPVITPDARTNRIFLMGRPVDLAFLKQLVSEWDVPSDQRNFLRRTLKYLPVSEFVPIAEAAISRTLGANAQQSGNRGSVAAGGANPNNTRNQNTTNNTGTGTTGTGGAGGGTSLSGSDRPTEPQSTVVGNTLLVSDNISNSLIVQGPPHHVEIVEQLLEELDVKNEQVASTSVGRILNSSGVGFTGGGGGSIISRDNIDTFADIAGDALGLSLQGFTGNFGVFLQALETYTHGISFDQSTVFTTNNKEARVSSGQQIAVPTSSFQGNTNSTTNFDYRDVFLEIAVRPLINSGDEITLEISLTQDTALAGGQEIDGVEVPNISSDQVDTIVTVPNGAAVLLGGFTSEREDDVESGVPILRSLPLLGRLFRDNSETYIRTELVIMIRPLLVDGKLELESFQNYYGDRSNISRETEASFDAPKYMPRRNSLDLNFKPSKVEAPEPAAKFTPASPQQHALQRIREQEATKLAIETEKKKKRRTFSSARKR